MYPTPQDSVQQKYIHTVCSGTLREISEAERLSQGKGVSQNRYSFFSLMTSFCSYYLLKHKTPRKSKPTGRNNYVVSQFCSISAEISRILTKNYLIVKVAVCVPVKWSASAEVMVTVAIPFALLLPYSIFSLELEILVFPT